jgi:secreted trypsin-like serine protease
VGAIVGQNVRQALDGEYPSAVAIVKVVDDNSWPENNMICTGILISNRDVMTASHCIEDEQRSSIKILIGHVDLREATEYFPQWWITFDEWAEEHEIESEYEVNDISIIRVSSY